MPDDFSIPPPSFQGGNQEVGWFPSTADAAWILQIIQTKLNIKDQIKNIIYGTTLPDDVKDALFTNMSIYVDNASMTNIERYQVNEFRLGYRQLWLTLRIFVVKSKYHGILNYLERQIEEILIQNLNKSIKGWLGNHVFEKKSTYDIRETKGVGEKVDGMFRRKKKQPQTEEFNSMGRY